MKTAAHLLIIALWIGLTNAAWSSPETIWSIGREDGSNKELALFGLFRDYAPRFPDDIRYVVGTSRPVAVWPECELARVRECKKSDFFEMDAAELAPDSCGMSQRALSDHPAAGLKSLPRNRPKSAARHSQRRDLPTRPRSGTMRTAG
jgi:hypothetical protein